MTLNTNLYDFISSVQDEVDQYISNEDEEEADNLIVSFLCEFGEEHKKEIIVGASNIGVVLH